MHAFMDHLRITPSDGVSEGRRNGTCHHQLGLTPNVLKAILTRRIERMDAFQESLWSVANF